MKQEWINTLRQMRDAGCAVIVWTPEELGDVEAEWVEERSIEHASDYLLSDVATDETRSYGPQGETA
jgi:hypothetical protein